MKRAFLLAALFIMPLWAYADDTIWTVFKVHSYTYNSELKSYSETQYGSSVYVGSWIIYTNAHVILDEDNKPIGNYEVCKTTDFKKTPVCFSAGELLYYDTDKDLAALKIKEPGTKKATLNGTTPNIGDSIKVYGYPQNGWNTISYTEGKVSGFENSMYKIDANIDSWNSGGWVFDKNGNLIGIATSVSVGYTTMGYIIPVKTLKEFIANKTPNHIEKYTKGVEANFKKYIELKQKTISSNKIVNKDVTVNPIGTWFSIAGFTANESGDIFAAYLKNRSGNVKIYLSTIEQNGYKPSNTDVTNKAKQVLSKNETIGSGKVSTISIGNKTAVIVTMVGKEDNDGAASFVVQYGTGKYFEGVITSKYSNDADFKKAIALFTKKVAFNTNVTSQAVDSNFTANNLVFKNFGKFSAIKSAEQIILAYATNDITAEYSMYSQKSSSYKDSTLEDYAKDTITELKDSTYLNTVQVRKTNEGQYYIYVLSKNNEDKDSSTVKKTLKKYKVNAVYFTKWDKDTIQQHFITFVFDTKESLKEIETFLSNISANWAFPFETGTIEASKNLLEKSEFEVQ